MTSSPHCQPMRRQSSDGIFRVKLIVIIVMSLTLDTLGHDHGNPLSRSSNGRISSFTELVSEPRQFCEAQRGNFRAAIGASRHVEEILLDGDLRGKEGELPPIGANSNTIAARCCQQYPKETGAELEHLKQPAFIAVKMSYRTTGSTPTLA